MRIGSFWQTFALLLLLLPASGSAQSEESHAGYTIDLANGVTGRLSVALETECAESPCDFLLPVWNATYQVRDFSQYIARVEAFSESGRRLALRKVAPSRWRLEDFRGPLRLEYEVVADRRGPFGAYVDDHLATISLGQVLLLAEQQRNKRSTLRFSGLPEGFSQAVALARTPEGYEAGSYDRLIDTPVLLAELVERGFEAGGKSIRLAVTGPDADKRADELEKATRKIVAAAVEVMGGAPFDEYLFAYVFSSEHGGGMEFRDGALIFGAADCRNCGLAALSAHEFIHLWNVKRIRPASMEPIDFERPQPSPSLWFAEGVTSTLARYILIRAGLMTPGELPQHLEALINDYEARPASRTQSAEEASIDAWLERHAAYGRADRSVSYYVGGEIIGHLLDLCIRHETANRRSLDDVMRLLDRRYAQRGRFFDDTAALEEAASEVAGADLTLLFDELVRTPSPIRWQEYLGYAGYELEVKRSTKPDSGLTLVNPPGRGLVVAAVFQGGPAEAAGLRVGDRLLRVNGRRATGSAGDVLRRLDRAAGQGVELVIVRDGIERSLELRPVKSMRTSYSLASRKNPSPLELEIREGWTTRTISQGKSAPPSE